MYITVVKNLSYKVKQVVSKRIAFKSLSYFMILCLYKA